MNSSSLLLDFLSGIFPQDEYPEDVSTDEDDDLFGSRKRMKRRGGRLEEVEEGVPASKKSKGISSLYIYLLSVQCFKILLWNL